MSPAGACMAKGLSEAGAAPWGDGSAATAPSAGSIVSSVTPET